MYCTYVVVLYVVVTCCVSGLPRGWRSTVLCVHAESLIHKRTHLKRLYMYCTCCARCKWSLPVLLLSSLYMTQAFTFFATHALELTNLDALYPNVEKCVGPDTSRLTMHSVGGAQSITQRITCVNGFRQQWVVVVALCHVSNSCPFF